MDGKIVIITGCNSGIGKYTAIELAKRGNLIIIFADKRLTFDKTFLLLTYPGARIIMACRDRSRAEEAMKEIRQLSNSHQIEIELVDLESLQSVRDCAKRLRDRLPRLDVLINNAGKLNKDH